MTPSHALPFALVELLDDDALDALAARLVPRLAPRLESTADHWLSSADAAAYLGLTMNSLHKLTAARVIPFEQDGPGCKLWFRREKLDAWRCSGGSRVCRQGEEIS